MFDMIFAKALSGCVKSASECNEASCMVQVLCINKELVQNVYIKVLTILIYLISDTRGTNPACFEEMQDFFPKYLHLEC